MDGTLRIGASACLLGADVRFDGQHKRSSFLTDALAPFVTRAEELAQKNLDGFVLKSKSPSCGMERVKLFAAPETGAAPTREGVGLFARALMDRLPNLPVEEEGRLEDARLRENFVERLFAHARLRRLFSPRWTLGALVAFHTAHKMQLLAHSTEGYRALGRLVARARSLPRADLRAQYERDFMATLKKPSTPGRHAP